MILLQKKQIFKIYCKQIIGAMISLVHKGKIHFAIMSLVIKFFDKIPSEFIATEGDTVVLIGVHRIDTVMKWSYLVGKSGKIIVIEAVPSYIKNIRINLEHHLNWPFDNIIYISKGVDSIAAKKNIQIGKIACFNKFSQQDIDDSLEEASFQKTLLIETDTLDNILNKLDIGKIDHIEMTISGMEYEAIKGMILTIDMVQSLHIRSLHMKDGALIYPKVIDFLEKGGLHVVKSKKLKYYKGRQLYAERIS